MIVHYMQFGMTPCMMPTPPKDWPDGHRWSGDWIDVNCATCLEGKEPSVTYTISQDNKSITCLRCKLTSYHPKDVEFHYCGNCHAFHDDLWPPARKWWVANPDKPPSTIQSDYYPVTTRSALGRISRFLKKL